MVYLRQSSMKQVRSNKESQRLQYGLTKRAKQLGFNKIEVVDQDLGISASVGARERPGFQKLLTGVAMGDVGLILSRELSRLSRTDKDWCQLMEICQISDTLIGDDEAIYDPNQFDDQLVLGIKGTISVAELNVLKKRMLQGKEAKAKRGELLCTVAPGYIRDGDKLIIDPNRRVREAILLVFDTFEELGSIRQTYNWFLQNNIELPVNKPINGGVELTWKLPAQTFIPSVLHNPIYAGAYVYGRRSIEKVIKDGKVQKRQRAILPPEETKVFIKDHHEGYISWERHLRIQNMISQNGTNFQPNEAILAVREGHGLLTGLLRCARCGHKLHVRYWGKQGTNPRYFCNGQHANGGSYCIGFGGKTTDKRISEEVLRIISPDAIAASLHALEVFDSSNSHQIEALKRQVEHEEYEAQRAYEQYNLADPKNRLVVDTLEKRWNERLEKLDSLKSSLDHAQIAMQKLSEKDKQVILMLGSHFKDTWEHPNCPMILKKKLIRAIIQEIIADVDEEKETLNFIIHWKGGSHSELQISRPLPANKAHKTAIKDIEVVKKMAPRFSDTEIAQVLSKQGSKTGKGHRWTKTSVATLRRKYGIKSLTDKSDEVILSLAQAKRFCGVSDSTILRLIDAKILPAKQVVPHAPFEIKKEDLESKPVSTILESLKKTGKLILNGDTLSPQLDLL